MFRTTPEPMVLTLRVIARLLSYPDAELRANVGELQTALHFERALGALRLTELDGLVTALARPRGLGAEAEYVETFDRGHGTALHLFEHVHGDSRERGPAMIDLAQTYEQAGLHLRGGELPDHLSVALEYASTQPPQKAREFLREIAHILQNIHGALATRRSGYAAAIAALLDLAGEPVRAVKLAAEPSLDESWQEPAAFDGCSTQGQARPGAPQPVRIVARADATGRRAGVQA